MNAVSDAAGHIVTIHTNSSIALFVEEFCAMPLLSDVAKATLTLILMGLAIWTLRRRRANASGIARFVLPALIQRPMVVILAPRRAEIVHAIFNLVDIACRAPPANRAGDKSPAASPAAPVR